MCIHKDKYDSDVSDTDLDSPNVYSIHQLWHT